jgi:hypothetical protein
MCHRGWVDDLGDTVAIGIRPAEKDIGDPIVDDRAIRSERSQDSRPIVQHAEEVARFVVEVHYEFAFQIGGD